jgi:hypothetical protein
MAYPFFEDLLDRRARGIREPGGNPHWFIELLGGEEVSFQFYEPDPKTFRDDYYYNSRDNRLYAKGRSGPVYFWKSVP